MPSSTSFTNLDSNRAAKAFNDCFADYLVKLAFTAEEFDRRFRAENVDPEESRVWLYPDQSAEAILMIARRGAHARVAAMAVAPASRGAGLGKVVLKTAIDGSIARGDRRLFLEVIEQNARARHVYEGSGFRVLGRLIGFVPPVNEAAAPGGIEEADARSIARVLAADRSLDELPWQLQAENLLNSTPWARGYRLGNAYALLALGPGGSRVMYASADERLLAALPSLGPIRAPAIFPEAKYATAFTNAGWTISNIAQLEMVREL